MGRKTSFVITVATTSLASAACGGSATTSNPPEVFMNPPPPDPEPPPPEPQPEPEGEFATPPDGESNEVAGGDGADVTRDESGKCWRHAKVDCPPMAMCNPPPPQEVPCPPEKAK